MIELYDKVFCKHLGGRRYWDSGSQTLERSLKYCSFTDVFIITEGSLNVYGVAYMYMVV